MDVTTTEISKQQLDRLDEELKKARSAAGSKEMETLKVYVPLLVTEMEKRGKKIGSANFGLTLDFYFGSLMATLQIEKGTLFSQLMNRAGGHFRAIFFAKLFNQELERRGLPWKLNLDEGWYGHSIQHT